MNVIDCRDPQGHEVRLQPSESLPQGHIVGKGAIESRKHAGEPVANIRVARPRRRGCRTAVLPSAEKLLALWPFKPELPDGRALKCPNCGSMGSYGSTDLMYRA